MFNRTAEYLAHGSRTLAAPFPKLRPEQRQRLEKSSKKVGKVLGQMPIIDILPASPVAETASLKPSVQSEEKEKKKGKGKLPPAPIMRYKLSPSPRRVSPAPRPATPTATIMLQVPGASERSRRAVPYSLNLVSPVWRSDDGPMSPFGYNRPGFLSPLSPLSPFSPIETSDMREERYHGLRRLARVSRAFRDTIVEELPSIAQTAEQADNVNTYLDLYRIASHAKRQSRDSDAYTACVTATPMRSAYTACSIKTRRRSSSLSRVHRRSIYSIASQAPSARSSFIVPLSASVAEHPQRFTLVIGVPSPRTPTAHIELLSAATSRASRMSYTIVLNLPPKKDDLPETPNDEDSPLQQQQREARARAAILSALRPRPLVLQDTPDLPQADLSPSPPVATPLARVRSPRVPYWVRNSYRAGAHGYVRRTHSYARRAGAGGRVPPTPRTIRREKRQGWGGKWTNGKIADACEDLKQLKTPAPVVRQSVQVDSEEVIGQAQ